MAWLRLSSVGRSYVPEAWIRGSVATGALLVFGGACDAISETSEGINGNSGGAPTTSVASGYAMASGGKSGSGASESSGSGSGGASLATSSSASVTGGGGSAGSAPVVGSTSGAGGGDGGATASCVPSDITSGGVASDCGVFVSSSQGDDGNDGSPALPFETLEKAIAAANGKPVYACGEPFNQAVTLAGAVNLYGGLDCANGWVYVAGKKTTLTAPADAIPLTLIQAARNVAIFDFAITSATAVTPGTSSIAVLANGASATFTRCDLTAGDGANGAAGTSASSTPLATPAKSQDGSNACSAAAPVSGGAQNENDCASGGMSIGGKGGDGNNSNGGDAGSGQLGNAGQGGKGEPISGTGWSCQVGGSNGGGNAGDNGASGAPGPGATGSGSLTAIGYSGTPGTAGTAGTPGQGGGGGGGAKGGTICGASPGPYTVGPGASGGAGGVGGCGGQPGQGGGPAGASIALASAAAAVILADCTLKSGMGGTGGVGGDSQPGALGGAPGLGGLPAGASNPGCDGGKGGKGGNGGPGGGGLGGPSIVVAFTGTAPALTGTTTTTAGQQGLGGPGGNNNIQSNAGANGALCVTADFAHAGACQN